MSVRYVALRLLQAVAVLWAAFTISFFVLFWLPSDPVSIAAAGAGDATIDQAAIAELQARYGLDQSLWSQYWTALGHALQGDFGRSISSGQPVTEAIAAALPGTAQLAGLALLLAVAGGTTLALAGTFTRLRFLRSFLLSLPPLGVAVPSFWAGLILLQLFSFGLPIFPAMGEKSASALVLPAITLAIPTGAVIAQVLANSIDSHWREPFVEVAQAKGASRWYVQIHHLLRISVLPALTIAGVTFGEILAGTVVTETVFSRSGVGRLTQTSVQAQDIPVVLAIVLLSALIYVLITLVVDLAYPFIDPRLNPNRSAKRSAAISGSEPKHADSGREIEYV